MWCTSVHKNTKINIRVVVLGDATVGKTSLVERYIFNRFHPTYRYSAEPESRTRTIKVGNAHVNLSIIDIGGHRYEENQKNIILPFLRISHGVLLVYDVSRKSRMSNLLHWFQLCEQNDLPSVYKVIIGNKSDLMGGAENCDISQINKISPDSQIPVFFTSAKTGSNVDAVFEFMLTEILQDIKL